jgi:hypothetical protein
MNAWFLCPYKRDTKDRQLTRYCAMNDYNSLIYKQDRGSWSEAEVEGDRAIVKVNASANTITTLEGVFQRLPDDMVSNFAAKTQYFKPPLRPRYDAASDTIILDGETIPCRDIRSVDLEVK